MNEIDQQPTAVLPAKKKGVARLIAATGYSIAGLTSAWKSEEAFRLEVVAFFVLAPLGIWLGESDVERVLLVGSLCLVLLMELLNSAIEAVVDLGEGEFHHLAKKAKDIGSAGVLVALLLVLFVWAILLL